MWKCIQSTSLTGSWPEVSCWQPKTHLWDTLTGKVMGKPKRKPRGRIVCGVHSHLSKGLFTTSTSGRRSTCILGNIRHPQNSIPAGCCRMLDIESSVQHESYPAFIRPLFIFLHRSRWWNAYTHIHWHSCCSTLRSLLASSLNFSCFSLPVFTHPTPASSHPPTGALESGFYLDLTELESSFYCTNVAQKLTSVL